MPAPVPLQYGQSYHVYNRGINRENIFFEKRNYRYFLQLYARHILPITDTYAYCLLPNHFHFLVRVKLEEEQDLLHLGRLRKPSQQFSNLFNAYTKAINRAYDRTGSLCQRPFGRIPVDSDAYFGALVVYIHRNPQKHRLIDDFREWPYSSYQTLLSTAPTQLCRDATLSWFQDTTDFQQAHHQEQPPRYIEPLIADDF